MSPLVTSASARKVVNAIAVALLVLLVRAPATEAQFETPSRQFHNRTSFPLDGRHRTVPCESCHLKGVYKGTPPRCYDCHWVRRQDDRYRLQLGAQCETCHKPAAWTAVQFQHAAVARGFQLVGRHASLPCTSCHANNVYRGTSRDCVGCHLSDYQGTSSPNHAGAGFSTTCNTCHRAADSAWQQGRFAHRFPITSGSHRQPCSTCHQSSTSYQVFTCLVCHEHDRVRMDDKHKERTGYRYDSVACYSCHPNGRH
jgi:hypothetical protein